MNTPPEFEESGPGNNQNDTNFDDEEASALARTYLWGR